MNNNANLLQNIDLSNLQIDYTQMQIPLLSDILNSDFMGFNNLDFGLRLFLLLLSITLFIVLIIAIIKTVRTYIINILKFISNKYEFIWEKRFNTLSSKQLDYNLKNLSKLLIFCDFDFLDKNSHADKLIEFSRAFLINHTAKIKHEKNSIIFIFDGFDKIINGVITQLYLTKTVFEQKYPDMKIYLSGTVVEKEENIEKQMDLVRGLAKLKISTKHLNCDTLFKFYYSLIKPQLYELQSNGEYLIQNETVEIYTMTQPIDRTL